MKDGPSKSRPLVRAAIVGAGLMGRWHAHEVRRAGGLLCAIIDPESSRATRLIQRHPRAKVVANLSAVAADGLADVVHICTPPETHEDLTRQALEAGLHSIVEKPLTESGDTTEKLQQLANARGRLLCPVHQFPFQRGVLRVQAAMETMGPLLHLDTLICSAGAERSSQNADRLVAEILPGPLSLVARLFNSSIRIADWCVEHPDEGELRATTKLGAVSVSMLISMSGRPTVNALRLIAERGTAYADLFHGFAVIQRGAASRTNKIAQPFLYGGATLFSATANLLARAANKEPAYPGLRELIRQCYVAIKSGGVPPILPAETLDVALARDQILAKASSK
jgi:predicted dehydrogenase